MIRLFTVLMCAFFLGISTSISAQSATLNGIVTDAGKSPLQNAHVIAIPDQALYWTAEDMTPLAVAQTGQNGEFRISVPTTGPVALVAWGPEHRMTKYKVNPQTAQSVMIGMALEPGLTVSGRVYDRAGNTPVTGAVVGPLVAGLDTETQRAQRVMPQWATVDAQGMFSLHGVATDIPHQFTVQADGYIISNVELSAGTTEVEAFMDKGGSTVSGEVYSRDMRPSAFAGTVIRANGNGFDVVELADEQAQFTFEGLPGGTFSIEPLLGESERTAKVEVVDMPDDNGTSISLEVSAGYYVRGITVDVETSAPGNQVPVGLNDRWTTSSTDGSFSLGPFYQPMQLTMEVPEEDGWKLQEVEEINEYNATDGFSDVNNVVVRVQRQRILDVVLSNYEVTTQPATITVLPEKGTAIRRQATSASLEIPVFGSGLYTIYGVSGGLTTELSEVRVGEQKNIPVVLRFAQASTAAGQLTLINTDETTRVSTFQLAMHVATEDNSSGPQLYGAASPREDGAFYFQLMPHGDYHLHVTNATGTRTTTHPVTLSAGVNTLPEIQWEAGNRISGTVVNPQGEPVPFAQVTLLQEDGEMLKVEAKEDGSFRAEDLPHDMLTTLLAEAAAFSLYREQNVALPADDKVLVMQPMGRLVIIVEAPQSTSWQVHVVRMSRWASGAYAEQLMGQPIFTREAIGGESLETGIGEQGRFRIVAVNKSSGALMVSEAFDWAGEQAKGETIYLRSTATGSIAGSAGDGAGDVEVTAINTAIPESVGREKAEFRVTTSNGRYQLTGLPAGNYLVLGAGEVSSSYALNVELTAGGTATADLDIVPMVTITGVVELSGEALPGAQVRLVSETQPGSEPVIVTTSADGSFTFEGMTPDSYAVSTEYVSGDDTLSAATAVVVKGNEEPALVRLDLTPPQPVLLSVAEGMNLPADTPVQLMNMQSRQLVTATWTNEGLIVNASPGRYEVWSGDAVVGMAVVAEDGTGTVTSP